MNSIKTMYAQNSNGEVFKVEKCYDDFAENPRTYSDYFSHFYTFEQRHTSPDEHHYRSASDWANAHGFSLGSNPEDLIASMARKGYVALPVWRSEPTGCSYQAAMTNPFCCPWDSGMVGVIYASREEIRNNYGAKRVSPKLEEKVLDLFRSEVNEYSSYANGDVYLFSLIDSEGNQIESVGDIYSDIESDEDIIKSYFGLIPV